MSVEYYCRRVITVKSVVTFGSACWGENAAKQDKDRLEKIIKKAEETEDRKQ